jgi:hypothetical protein
MIIEYTIPDQNTFDFFKKGSWYKGLNGDNGLIAKSSGDPENNKGWWSGTPFTTRLVNPNNWEEITDTAEIEKLEAKLLIPHVYDNSPVTINGIKWTFK